MSAVALFLAVWFGVNGLLAVAAALRWRRRRRVDHRRDSTSADTRPILIDMTEFENEFTREDT